MFLKCCGHINNTGQSLRIWKVSKRVSHLSRCFLFLVAIDLSIHIQRIDARPTFFKEIGNNNQAIDHIKQQPQTSQQPQLGYQVQIQSLNQLQLPPTNWTLSNGDANNQSQWKSLEQLSASAQLAPRLLPIQTVQRTATFNLNDSGVIRAGVNRLIPVVPTTSTTHKPTDQSQTLPISPRFLLMTPSSSSPYPSRLMFLQQEYNNHEDPNRQVQLQQLKNQQLQQDQLSQSIKFQQNPAKPGVLPIELSLNRFFSTNYTSPPVGIIDGPLYRSLLGLQNPSLFGGDILIRTDQRPIGRVYKFERSALVSAVNRWPNGVIFYELDSSVTHLARLIWSVMQQFHDETCIKFMPRLNDEPDYLHIEAHRGCFSYIGRIGGKQILSLGAGCDYRGTIAHELLHAVGFYHHQNRSDRDDFLEIIWDNIAKGKEGQFNKMAPSENVLLNEFDYNSIMLYGPHTFGKTLDKITMKPKREGVILLEVIEKQGLSALDIDSVNKLYECDPYSYKPE